MNTIIIPTTQNIELEYPVAHIGDRILSGLIDLGVLVAYTWFWIWLLQNYQTHDNWEDYATDTIYLLALLPAMTYSLWTESWFQGRTLGKKLMNLRTIRLDGASPGFSEYALRWMLRIVDIWVTASVLLPGLIGMITISTGKKGQRLGDISAGTSVVKMRLVTTFSDTIFVETQASYQVNFPEISRLSDRDISILKEVLDAGTKNDNPVLIQKLANKVQAVIGVQSTLPPDQFLAIVLKDYNFLFRD
ncbi:MAG: RDD family protein [Bacteroidia bacterium]|nr:RDD family protein [Bacteroidia bacterium]